MNSLTITNVIRAINTINISCLKFKLSCFYAIVNQEFTRCTILNLARMYLNMEPIFMQKY